jgi:hypothetical protein
MKHRFGAKFRNRWAIKIKVTGKNQPIGKQKKSSFEIRDGNRHQHHAAFILMSHWVYLLLANDERRGVELLRNLLEFHHWKLPGCCLNIINRYNPQGKIKERNKRKKQIIFV